MDLRELTSKFKSKGVLEENRSCLTCDQLSYPFTYCRSKTKQLNDARIITGCNDHEPWVNAEYCPKCGSQEISPLRDKNGAKRIKCIGCNRAFGQIMYVHGH